MQQYKIRDLVNEGQKIINPSFTITNKDKKRATQVITGWQANQLYVFRCRSINRTYWALAFYEENEKMIKQIYN